MPFKSRKQEAFLWANHPDIARRWLRESGSGQQRSLGPKTNPSSESHETWKQGMAQLPRKPGELRDFGMLKPSAEARMTPKSKKSPNLKESDKEVGIQFVHGSRGTKLGKTKDHPAGLRGRDTRVSTRKA
jgi:hypothetical protein